MSVPCIDSSRFRDSRALAKILELQIEAFFFQIPIVLELSCSFHKKRVKPISSLDLLLQNQINADILISVLLI
jgi:hypothetical protein